MNNTIIIKPTRGFRIFDIARLWEYRDLLYFLAWRDIKVRYKQTVLGAGWAIIQPFLAMAIFSLFFGKLGRIPSEGIPYPVFAYSALVPWQLFSQSLNYSANSLVNSQQLIKKVYFPRLIVPTAAVAVGLIDFFFAFLVLPIMVFYYHFSFISGIWFLPVLILMTVLTALGTGIWLSALNVLYRDVRYLMPFLIQIWFFLTPIVYPTSLVPEKWRLVYSLNPMAGIIEGFRWAVLGKGCCPFPSILVSAAVILITLISGLFFFRRIERTFADVI